MPTTISGTATSFITFSRSSTATRVNSSGLIETVSANTPRLDYNPVTLAPRGLLVEEQRTNLLLRSAEFDNAAWSKSNVTVTANSTVSPAGTTDADTLTNTTAATACPVTQNIVATNTVYTFSIWVMAGNTTTCSLSLRDTTAAANLSCSAVILSGPGSVSGTTITNVTGLSTTQWTRVAITTTTAVPAGNSLSAYFYPEIASPSSSVTGGKSNIVWGAQLEAGAFATSYIPTTTASATRSADVASVATSAFPYSSTESTVVASVSLLGYNLAGSSQIVSALSLNAADTAYLSSSASSGTQATANTLLISRVSSSNVGAISQNSQHALNTPYKIAGAYKQDDFALSVNGGAVTTDTAGAMPAAATALQIGNVVSANYLNGHIRQITYIPRRLTNAELQTRST